MPPQPQRSSTVALEIDGAPAQIVLVRRGEWRFTFVTDRDPATGAVRDIETIVEAIVSAPRRAAA